MTTNVEAGLNPASGIDSSYAWVRLAVALVLSAVGSVGMWSFVVALPAVQADFGIARGEASLAFTLTMFGFGIGGVVMGRLADRSAPSRSVPATGSRASPAASAPLRWPRVCSVSAARRRSAR